MNQKQEKKKILIVFAHPFPEKSRVNKAMIAKVRDLPGVTVSDLYEKYPDFHIDPSEEQKLLLKADFVILHHPTYWFSSPPIVKEWIFVVLEHGFAQGKGGEALRGKEFMLATSAAGPENSYKSTGFNKFTMEEFLRPFEQTARVCNMEYRQPFIVYGTPNLTTQEIDTHAEAYRSFLKLISERKDI
ncbi:MAG: NAD(P)H-dependent oxidoreductase [Nitrospinota bacterium]